MGTRDLVLVGVHESPAPHDVLALDDEPLDEARSTLEQLTELVDGQLPR